MRHVPNCERGRILAMRLLASFNERRPEDWASLFPQDPTHSEDCCDLNTGPALPLLVAALKAMDSSSRALVANGLVVAPPAVRAEVGEVLFIDQKPQFRW